MPLTTDTSIVLDICQVNIDVQNQVILLTINRGYQDTQNVFQVISQFNVTVAGAEVSTLFALASPDTTTPLYSTLKNALYNYIIANGIATGTIS